MPKGARGVSPEFELLAGTVSHVPALMAAGECYLALPKPDANFVTDLQANNFASRLFELYLLACFREQGLIVRQDQVSPDFWIEKDGTGCWIEAVTANSETPRAGGIGDWMHAPKDRNERLTGAPAERFAKTLRSKLQRNYHELDHVTGRSLAIAIADFHASGSMVWSREALPTYLYGLRADVKGEGAHRRALGTRIANLTGKHGIPAGLFRDPSSTHLSAVIFSNAGTLAKFNRMGFPAGWQPPGLEMIRRGILFDRTPGALEPIDFELSVGSDEYQSLWPWGGSLVPGAGGLPQPAGGPPHSVRSHPGRHPLVREQRRYRVQHHLGELGSGIDHLFAHVRRAREDQGNTQRRRTTVMTGALSILP